MQLKPNLTLSTCSPIQVSISFADAHLHSCFCWCIYLVADMVFCRLVECLALAKLPLTPAQHKQLHSSIDENLRHPTASIQSAACSALAAFTATYMPTGDAEAIKRTSDKYLGLLTDPNVAVKRGAAAALGALPTWLLEPLSRQILAMLAAATQVWHHALTKRSLWQCCFQISSWCYSCSA